MKTDQIRIIKFQDVNFIFQSCHQRIASVRWPFLPSHFAFLAILFSSFITLVATPSAVAQEPISPTEAMLTANQNYEAGNFDEAAAGYEAIIAFGIDNSNVYYNLGNAYFKLGDLGRAILNYRRAYRLDPRDPDITTNLTVARAQTIDQLEVTLVGALGNLVLIAEEWLTLSEAAILALVLWLLICGLLVLSILRPRLRRWAWVGTAVLGLFLVIGMISIANRYYTDRRYPAAVIVAQQVDVTSGPGAADQYLVEFDLHSGAEVRLVESRPGWRRITLPGDLQGWAPADAVESVVNP